MRTQWCLELNYCLFVSDVVLVFAFLSQDKYLASTQPKAKILPGGGYETPFDSRILIVVHTLRHVVLKCSVLVPFHAVYRQHRLQDN